MASEVGQPAGFKIPRMAAEGNIRSTSPLAAQTRGFLFADIRGYTEFVEREGAAAAKELLTRYRTAVRAAIAEHQGAEIRTEGDSFYVVLPSASAALLCALSIVQRVDEGNADTTQQRLGVGIGVHAGDTLDTDEGLIGSAVNIAARLAALAKPGEILVSETVKTLTRSVVTVAFTDRGRQRLKGVTEPIAVFAVAPAGAPARSAVSRVRSRPLAAVVSGVAVTLILAMGFVVFASAPASTPTPVPTRSPVAQAPTPAPGETQSVSSGSPTPTTTAAATPTPSGPAPIVHPDVPPGLGTYTPMGAGDWFFRSFRPAITLLVDEAWTDRSWYPFQNGPDFGALFAGRRGADSAWDDRSALRPGILELEFVRPRLVSGNPCDPGDSASNIQLDGTPQGIVNWLDDNKFLDVSAPQPATVGGYSGESVDVAVKDDPGKVCGGASQPGLGSVFLFRTSPLPPGFGGTHVLHDGEKARFFAIDVGGDSPLVVIARTAESDFETLLPWAQEMINTVTVTP